MPAPDAAPASDAFRFSLTDEEKRYLKDLVKLRIVQRLKSQDRKETPAPEPPSERLKERFGVFVTLKIRGRLRGCIGHIVGDAPLCETVSRMALAAAFEDPRFSPLRLDEFEQLEIEISILSPLELCSDPARIVVGRHGLLLRKGGRSGLLLPQVPVEWGWSRETFLKQTCAKAGLPADAWRENETEIYWFEAEVF
jgi:AmmeMemoRadiSam system protein A